MYLLGDNRMQQNKLSPIHFAAYISDASDTRVVTINRGTPSLTHPKAAHHHPPPASIPLDAVSF
jgi:hypothetical protein